MSRDNTVNISAGGNVNVEALAVGDGAQAAAIHSATADKIAEHFLQIRTVLDDMEAKGELSPAAAKLLREETVDTEASAKKSLEDESEKETLTLKLSRLASGLQSFCSEKRDVFGALASIAACCMVRLPLPGLTG